ncbi:S locus-related glycoprotein 1 binding pollen coat [Melia azedarach]|uniref:S locus-related glycoprotein 1 binding pollen coat n=1 Tax=Melia azedarach TaxID=155640 RepID=A0ACC1YLI2_MELAZ|nr:S locus-related glycoprotein 1 binding pollen coat [Melia azedarach]
MKNSSVPSMIPLLLLLLLVASGNEMIVRTADAAGATPTPVMCTATLHGGGCSEADCNDGCAKKYGGDSHGFCFQIRGPESSCVCRYSC